MQRLKKRHIVIILCAVIALMGLFFTVKILQRAYVLKKANVEYPLFDGAVAIKRYQDHNYYILKKAFDGEHDIQTIWRDDLSGFGSNLVMDYQGYRSFCEKWKLTEKYHDPDVNYIVFSTFCKGVVHAEAILSAVEYDSSNVNLYLWYEFTGATADNTGFVCIIPTDRSVMSVNLVSLYTEEEYDYILRYGVAYDLKNQSYG